MAISGLTGSTSSKLYDLLKGIKRSQPEEVEKPERNTDKYLKRRDEYLDSYLNREPYSFNINTDKLYQQYADSYKKQGEAAMRDTVAAATAKTGGYGSSYGVTAGAQAYQSYLDKLNDVVPELEERAYNRYTKEGEALLDGITLLDDFDTKEYGKYRDDVDDYKDMRDYYRDVYEYENDYDFDLYKAMTEFVLGLAKLENDDYYDGLDYELALKKLLYS